MMPALTAMIAASMALVPTTPATMTTDRALAIANAAWGNPCTPVIIKEELPQAVLGEAYIGCTLPDLIVNSVIKWDWPTYCTMIVHERGHQAGEQHSYNTSSVMTPVMGYTWKYCLPQRLWKTPQWRHRLTTQRR